MLPVAVLGDGDGSRRGVGEGIGRIGDGIIVGVVAGVGKGRRVDVEEGEGVEVDVAVGCGVKVAVEVGVKVEVAGAG
jgi:hypothetical protein